jgi:hypothetical protein
VRECLGFEFGSASTSSNDSVRLVMNAKRRQSGNSSAWSPTRRGATLDQLLPADHRLRDLRLTGVRVVLRELPVLFGESP